MDELTKTALHDLFKWKEWEKIVFRFFFLYFLLQVLPLDYTFYEELFSIHWIKLSYKDIFTIAHYTPVFFGMQGYANWAVAALIAIIGTVTWTIYDKKNQEYNALYYWLRVVLRYRLAIALFAYGFIKLFPLQAPYPSLSNLNTGIGYFSDWKLFSLSLGIVPAYESFLGLLEIVFASLLLFRKTASIGAVSILAFLGNVFVSNLAYEGEEYVYSLFLISISLFLLAFDIRRLLNLFLFERPATPNLYHYSFKERWKKYGRLSLKAGTIFFFVFLYGFKTSFAYHNDPYKIPNTAALKDASGIYNVSFFRINKDTLPYSVLDSVRWRDVVFEKWGTLSTRSERGVIIQSNNVEKIYNDNKDRPYELEGSAGRHYYNYTIDEKSKTLIVQNKNKNYSSEKFVFKYKRPTASEIILYGVNEKNDSIYVILDRINKKYLLEEVAKQGRKNTLTL